MIIRKATEKDTQEILVMMKELFLTWDAIDPIDKIDESWFKSKDAIDFINQEINDKNMLFLIAEEKEIAGYLLAKIENRPALKEKNLGLIDELYIKPNYRKQALGKQLTEKALEWFKEKNLKWTIVLTHEKDELANSYWKHMNYKDYNKKYCKELK